MKPPFFNLMRFGSLAVLLSCVALPVRAGTFYLFSNYESSFEDWDGSINELPTEPKSWDILDHLSIRANELKGYRFLGWYTKKSGWSNIETPSATDVDATPFVTSREISGADIAKAGKWTTSQYPTIVAKYMPIYEITTSVSPAGTGDASGDGTYDEGASVRLSSSAKDGYALKGWEKGGQLVSTTNFSFVAAQGCAGTYTAVFTGKVYRVDLYRTDSSEGGTDHVMATYGQPMPTPIELPKRYGYDFGGYFEQTQGKGVQYYDGAGNSLRPWDKTSSGNLYSHWIPKIATLTIELLPGVAKVCYRFGQDDTWFETTTNAHVAVACDTRVYGYGVAAKGYEMAKWTLYEQFESKMVPDGLLLKPEAKKGIVYRTVKFADPSWTNAATQTVIEDGGAVSPPVWMRDGYELSWNPDGFAKVTEDFTANAVWTPITSVVRFDPNGGEGTMADQTAVYDQALTLNSNKFVNGSLFFAHWTTSVDQVEYPDGAVVSNLTTVAGATNVFYAVWEKHSYSIRFNANGGAGKMADQSFDYGETKSLTKNAFTRNGWRFVRWQGPGETTYEDGESVTSLTTVDGEVIELFAVWSDSIDNPYSIAADCARTTDSEMAVELTTTDDETWCAILDEGAFNGNQCLRLMAPGQVEAETAFPHQGGFSLVAPTDGTITFYYQVYRTSEETDNHFDVKINDSQEPEMIFGPVNSWTQYGPVNLNQGDVFNFLFHANYNEGSYALVDAVTFVPAGGGSHPDPEAKDAVTISSAAVADGKFSLSFVSDEQFDYNLLTNANLLIDSWGVMGTEKGTGKTVTFEPLIIDGMPQLFYKVETIRKQD